MNSLYKNIYQQYFQRNIENILDVVLLASISILLLV